MESRLDRIWNGITRAARRLRGDRRGARKFRPTEIQEHMFMHRAAFMVIGLLAFGGLGGCAAVVLTAGSMAAGTGINHTLTGITYKTFVTPVNDLQTATLATLDKMDMSVTDIKEVKAGWEIKAKAYDRIIEIELEALTRRSTRMRVVANQGEFFFKDAATATEIIIQTAATLDHTVAKK